MLSNRSSTTNSAWRLASLPVALAALLALAAPAAAQNPPGNNGTVKVDAELFDNHPDNQPHVGCNFQVDFYGFDATGADAQVIFELQPPTAADQTMSVSGDTTPPIGGDDNSGGGSEAGLDASVPYTLSFTGAPHPQQGYHVKLTIHAPGSQGADVKHKVYWVTGCEAQVPPPPPPGNGNGGNGNGGGNGGGQQASQPPREATQAGVGGPAVSRVPDTATGSGSDVGALTLVAAMVVLGGAGAYAGAVVRSRRDGEG
jgi:hypothetical protein